MFALLTSGPGLAALAIAAALAFGGVQTYRLQGCKADKAQAEAQVTVMGSQIAEQNRAVEALQAAGVAKTAEGVKALRKAEVRAKGWEANAARLRAVLASRKPTDAQDCKAAWQEIRK